MTSPGGSSEHISRYRAVAEFDSLIREANKARKALRELREEESKLNAQSMAEDRKVAQSKAERARAEKQSADAVKKNLADLSSAQNAGKAGEATGVSFNKGMHKGIQNDPGFQQTVRMLAERFGKTGGESGNSFVQGFATKLRGLNGILSGLGMDKLDLDVDIEDARQSIKAVEFELNRLGHSTANPQVRIDTNRALVNLRAIQRLFKDEVAESMIKESQRIQKELKVIDGLPSGRAFKFWALTALSDMTKVFKEVDRGAGVFERLRRAAAAGGGGGGTNFIRSFVSGFDEFSESTSRLLQRLGRVSGELYRMPGIIAVLVASIPALVAGIGALGGGALGLSSALGALSGFLAAGPGLLVAFGSSIGVLSSAFGGLGEALKAAKKAQEAEAEAKEKARLGTDKALTAAQKYAVAMRELDPSTRKFTEAFIKFTDKYADVQTVITERFFKGLADDTDRLNKLLPIAQNFLGQAADTLGRLAGEGLKMMTSGPWKRDFAIIAKDNAKNIDNMGTAGLSLANVFRNIVVAAGPFTTWVTGALREGAKSFEDWSARARSDGSIADFLMETSESGQILWQILKNLGSVVNSFFQSTVDEGQVYLKTLEGITAHWADVAEAQEAANSPLRRWMTDIAPVLSALGALIGALARGIADLAADQNNIQSMIDLLTILKDNVLPPILDILQHLSDSGIANTVAKALGDLLDALATFLDSGATQALTVFVTVLANFAELLFNIASLPGISNVLGALAAGIATLAAVSIVARFSGLFKLWDFFTWMTRNKGNLSGAFADAARGVAGLQTNAAAGPVGRIPSPVYTGVGAESLQAQAKATERVGQASQDASRSTGIFARALNGISAAGNTARGALSSLSGFVGGPWGVALIAATALVGIVTGKLIDNKREAQQTKDAFIALKGAYEDLSQGNTKGVEDLAAQDEKFKDVVNSAQSYGVTLRDVSGALNGQEQSVTRFNSQMDRQIAQLIAARDQQIAYAQSQGDTTGAFQQGIDAVNKQIEAAQNYRNTVNGVADTNRKVAESTGIAADVSRTYTERLAGLTQAQVDNAVQAGAMDTQIRTLSSALDVMASATATTQDRSRALSDIIQHETGAMEAANEASENWSSQLLGLSEAVDANGRSLSKSTREGLRNRDALEAAAKATRELYLQDIAAGTPMDEALKRHQDRIKELKEEAKRLKLSKEETQKLIDTYGDVPESVKTDIQSDSKGFAQVYADLMKLQIMQKALQEGKSIGEAQKDWVSESSKLYQRPPRGDGYGTPGFKEGGPVWGPGTRRSDSIRAWLSNGEFVQPTDAVEHYGMPIMEALRTRKLDKAALNEALPDNQSNSFSSGGAAHSANCASCAAGGHKFARGGGVGQEWPFTVNPRNTKIDKDWVNQGGGIGMASGSGGVGWMMGVLRKQFPGLPLISGYRPGSRTLSGNKSYHSLNRAVDLPPRRDVAAWIKSNYGGRTKELITPFQDLNLHNGRPHRYTGAIWNQHNFAGGNAHDHWAFNQGGIIDVMRMLGMGGGLSSRQNNQIPSTPRSLSPAASSVVNNTTESGTNFGDVIINNPLPERGGDSFRNALYRTRYLL
jgi:hypothetical protein